MTFDDWCRITGPNAPMPVLDPYVAPKSAKGPLFDQVVGFLRDMELALNRQARGHSTGMNWCIVEGQRLRGILDQIERLEHGDA